MGKITAKEIERKQALGDLFATAKRFNLNINHLHALSAKHGWGKSLKVLDIMQIKTLENLIYDAFTKE